MAPLATRKRKGKGGKSLSETISYQKKIAAIKASYLAKQNSKLVKTANAVRPQSRNKADSWSGIKKSIPRLVSIIPTRSHSELLAIYLKCIKRMAGRKPAEISPALLELHEAILKEWKRRTSSLLAGEGFFNWPTTDAPHGDGSLTGHTWRSVGMLSVLGYHAGTTEGLTEAERRLLLDEVFTISLPPLNDRFYMDEWGEPKTAQRLKKLAETLAALTRNAKRRSSRDLQAACDDWESDLQFLYRKYYIQYFHFSWPTY